MVAPAEVVNKENKFNDFTNGEYNAYKEHVVTGLTNGVSYWFRIRAVNKNGAGPYSEVPVIAVSGVPGRPTGLKAVPGNGLATLSWRASSDGGSRITGWQYRVKGAAEGSTIAEFDSNDRWITIPGSNAATTSYTVIGLNNRLVYRFQVRAINANGAGSASTSAYVDPGNVPGAPTTLTGAPSRDSVTLSWTPPVTSGQLVDGGSPIIRYEYSQKVGTGQWGAWRAIPTSGTNSAGVTATARQSYKVSGLTAGTRYRFRVRAVNATGAGGFAETPKDYYPGARPSAPRNVSLTSSYDARLGFGRVRISWAPGNNGGSPVTKWQYKVASTASKLASKTTWVDICDAEEVPTCASMTSVTVPPTSAPNWRDPRYGFKGWSDNQDYYIVVRALNDFHDPADPINTGGLPSAVAHTRIEAHVPPTPVDFYMVGYTKDPKANRDALGIFEVYTVDFTNRLPRLRDEISFRTDGGPWSVWHRGSPSTVFQSFNDICCKIGTTYTIRYRHVNRLGPGHYAELQFVWGAPPLPGAAHLASDSGAQLRPRLVATPGTSRVTLGVKKYTGSRYEDTSTDDKGVYSTTAWEYSYKVGDGGWSDWTLVNQGAQFAGGTSYLVDGLNNGAKYTFRIRGVNDRDGTNPLPGQILESQFPPTIPGIAPPAPLGLSAAGGDRQVTLSWTSSGTAAPPITKWQYCDLSTRCDAESDWTDVPASNAGTTTAIIRGLTNGSSHTYRVRAVNAIGAGAVAETLSVTPGRVPGAPVRALVEAGDGRATIRVTRPGQDHGNRVVGYEVRKRRAGGAYDAWEALGTTVSAGAGPSVRPSAESTGAVVYNLVNGVGHTFQVRAKNVFGPGPHVQTSVVVPIGAPFAGTLTARAGNARAVLSWSGARSGGSTITGWQYRQRQGGAGYGAWTDIAGSSAGTTTHTVTGLSNGLSYRFEVRAITANQQVRGLPFASSTVVPSTVPPRPVSVGATGGDARATLSWTAGPSGRPGEATWASVTTGWQYRRRTGSGAFGAWMDMAGSNAATAGHVVTGLMNGVSYTFEIRAINAMGAGPSATASATPATVPSAPTLTATAGDAMATLSWTPGTDGGTPVTGWQSRTNDGQWADLTPSGTGTANTVSVPNLDNGVAHTFEVRATNAVGAGPAATASATPVGVPSAPELTATAGDAVVTLAWTPTGDGGSAVTGWHLRRDGEEWVDLTTMGLGADANTVSVPNLDNGVAYTFEVRATNAVGPGPAATASATPVTTPAAPEVSVAGDDGEIALSWTSGGDGGSAITGWQYRMRIGVGDYGEWIDMGADADGTSLTGLDSGTGVVAYVFGVRAVNEVGTGAETTSAEVTPVEASTASDRYYSGVVAGPNFCTEFSLGGARLFALDGDGDGVADTCSLPYTRREAIARQNAVVTLANRYPDQYRALVNAACAEVEGDKACGGRRLNAPRYAPADDGGPYYSGVITGPGYCANASLGGPTTYPLDGDGDGVADTCSLPYTRREAIARQIAGDTLAALYRQRFKNELAEECRRLGGSDYGDDPTDLAADVCTP